MKEDIKSYLEKVRIYELLVNEAINLSCKTFGKEVETWEEQIASDLFGRVCAIGFSLLKLIPGSEVHKRINVIGLWDYSSICILSRAMFDSYLILFHYCIDIPDDKYQREFKKLFWDYYIEYKRIEFLESIGSTHPDLAAIKARNTREFQIIRENNFFSSLKYGIQKEIEYCKKFQIPNNTQIANKAGIETGFYKSHYDYLSRYVHSDSFCIDQLAIFKAGSQDSYNLIESVLDCLTVVLSFSIRDFIQIRPVLENDINVSTKSVIEDSKKLSRN